MERAAWSDDRLDDFAGGLRGSIDRIDADVRDLREEFAAVRTEMRGGFAELREEIDAFRQTMIRIGGGMMIALVGVIAAILARGA